MNIMTIPPNSTQEELEEILSTHIRQSIRTVVLTGLLLSPFCYLRCLLNPLWVLGLKVPGIFVTALFTCYVGWQYVNGNPAAGESALLWWAVWAAIMLLIHYILFSLIPIELYRNSKRYQPPTSTAPGTAAPQALTIPCKRNPEGYPQAEVTFHAPKRGLYALQWDIEDYHEEFIPVRENHITRAAYSQQSTHPEHLLTEIYRLEAGSHLLCLRAANRDAAPPASVTLTQLCG